MKTFATNHAEHKHEFSDNFVQPFSKGKFIMKRVLIAVAFTFLTAAAMVAQHFEEDKAIISTCGLELPAGRDGSFAFVQDADQAFPALAIAGNNVYHGFVRIYDQHFHTYTLVQDLKLDIHYSRLAWADFDADGDSDLLVTGLPFGSDEPITRVYINNNWKGFRPMNTQLTGVCKGSAEWGDYNQDGFADILISGETRTGIVTKLYKNVRGIYFEPSGISLAGVAKGAALFGDYDLDGWDDILLTGKTDNHHHGATQIFRNVEGKDFEMIDAELPGMITCDAAWTDFDSDGDMDIILAGKSEHGKAGYVLENEGGHDFKVIDDVIHPVSHATISVGDVNNDGDVDVLVTGRDHIGSHVALIYHMHDGEFGEFNLDAHTQAHFLDKAQFVDYDDDGDLDIAFMRANLDFPKLVTLRNELPNQMSYGVEE